MSKFVIKIDDDLKKYKDMSLDELLESGLSLEDIDDVIDEIKDIDPHKSN